MQIAKRGSGVLMHISSLPSPHGIGSLGIPARQFADFLAEAGQSYWQLLPVCPTGYGDSPYQTFSTFAGNPYFIDLDELEQEGLLEKSEYETINWESSPDAVNYGALYQKRYPLLRIAAERFFEGVSKNGNTKSHTNAKGGAISEGDDALSKFSIFCRENAHWLEDYALFMAIKNSLGGLSWTEWPMSLRSRSSEALQKASEEYKKEIRFQKWLQFAFFSQWNALREYVNRLGIKFIGDLPFYVALDSADVWANPDMFLLGEDLTPQLIAGCPPDGFSADGQLWGNPLYDWKHHKETDYAWWFRRIQAVCSIYDILRIDHFRAFDSYYAIPADAENAGSGSWQPGPGIEFFREMEEKIGPQRIIAEDLGFLTDSVRQLLKESGFPGMRVLQLAFDRREESSSHYLPHNYVNNCVAYTGTHDNDTIQGWFETAAAEDTAYAIDYLRLSDKENHHWDMMCALMASIADTTILQAQDLLGLGHEARMNTPSTLGANWQWRAMEGSFDKSLAAKLCHYTELYDRINDLNK